MKFNQTLSKLSFFAFFFLMNMGFGLGTFLFGLLGSDCSKIDFGDRYLSLLIMSLIFMLAGLFYIIYTAINLSKFSVGVSIKDIMENPQ